ncbi:MAG: hypothetical protein HYT29_01020 [Parcubacteria group bacterium]|nr:hypothetical protein [Parcubacteria group bacterium]
MLSKTSSFPKYLFALLLAIAILAPVGFLYAADPPSTPTYVQLAPLSGLTPPSSVVTQTGLAGYLQTLFWLAITVAGVLAVLVITLGGVQYMTTEAFGAKGAAKNRITMAIVGFLIAISAVLILQTINPDLLTFKFITQKLDFDIPKASSLTEGTISGCTVYASAPVTQCLWADYGGGEYQSFNLCSSALNSNNYVDLADTRCAQAKPSNDITSRPPVCCGYIPPQSGCSGKGVEAGFNLNCQWSPSCEDPSFLTDASYCDGPRSGVCCASPI